MNPHLQYPTSPSALAAALWRNRDLLLQMVRREVMGRYRGSLMGIGWSLFHPILMLTVYTFVFSTVLHTRWTAPAAGEEPGHAQFAIILFAGLIIHGLFAEVLSRAPGLVPGNANYVKKVVFPLEILPMVTTGAAVFHAAISLGVLLVAFFLSHGYVNWTAALIPLILLPLVVLTLGLAWLLASLGTFLRDVGQAVGVLMTVLLFLSPVFYPTSSLPEPFRALVMINPLTFVIEQARDVLIWGHAPHWAELGVYAAVSVLVAWGGFAWFQKTRKGFADVL